MKFGSFKLLFKAILLKFLPVTFITLIIAILRGMRFRMKSKIIKNKNVSIFANAPSLSSDIKRVPVSGDIMGVNHLADTEFFVKYKPSLYLLLDYYFWDKSVDLNYKLKRDKLYKNLNNLTSWQLNLYLPSFADISYISSKINNKNINIKPFNSFYIRNSQNIYPLVFKPSKIIRYFWKENIIAPPPMNVAGAALYLSSLLGYKSLYLYGCEMSYFKTLAVDPKTNFVQAVFKHFYGDEKKFMYEHKSNLKKSSLSFELKKWAYIFESFSNLSFFLKEQGIQVFNCNPQSYLDCFEKIYNE